MFDCVNAEWVSCDQTVQVAGSVHNAIIYYNRFVHFIRSG